MNIVLWIIQILVALLFLFAGGTKLVIPIDQLLAQGPPNQVVFPAMFLKFIGVCEVLGGLGLLLPGLLRKFTGLTPVAAAGLFIIMIGATVVSFIAGGITGAIMPVVVGALCGFIAYGRWKVWPHGTVRKDRQTDGAYIQSIKADRKNYSR